ncbi:MAG TPA: glycosyltransferase family 39 protein [Gemmatimonadales bacterium]|nr:glycosyltransferase family 39 protein [Gemmatimonadales bacterium]
MNAAGTAARLVGLWALSSAARWLAAMPIVEPRIFRDELIHWQMARAFAFHEPFVLFGQVVHYPAVLYPAVLSVAFSAGDARAAFDVAQAVNAMLVSAVVFPAYALAREFGKRDAAVAVAALAVLTPCGVYSALMMEENLYYPLFVLACWLALRVLLRGRARDAAACAVALGLAYLAKPLALVLIGAYGVAVFAWGALALRGRGRTRDARGPLLAPFAVRAGPLIALGAALLARHALAAPAQASGSAGAVLLSRFYAEEMSGPIIPAIAPAAAVAVALLAALALGTGVVPVASLVSRRSERTDPTRAWLAGFAVLVMLLYLLAGARHTVLMNSSLRPHERYLFAVGPLLFAAFLTARTPPIGRVAAGVVLATIVLSVSPLAHLTLTRATPIDAPSLTLPWLLRRNFGSGLEAAAVIGLLALMATLGAARARSRLWPCTAWLAVLPLVLNVGWYSELYSQTSLGPPSRLITAIEQRIRPDERVAVVLLQPDEAIGRLSYYLKFWLGERSITYWASGDEVPWYADLSGPAENAAQRAIRPGYLVGGADVARLCPAARAVPALEPGPKLPVVVLHVPASGCGAPTESESSATTTPS